MKTRDVLRVQMRTIDVCERHTGFIGTGNFPAEKEPVIVSDEELACTG